MIIFCSSGYSQLTSLPWLCLFIFNVKAWKNGPLIYSLILRKSTVSFYLYDFFEIKLRAESYAHIPIKNGLF